MYLMAQFVEYIPAYNILNLMFMGLISNSVFYIALSSLVVLHSLVYAFCNDNISLICQVLILQSVN